MTKDSGLRGRGGAGFPTGMKWGFLPPPDGGPRYLVVNADESEPGTCKDIPLMMAAPHFLIEGVAITSFAIGCNHAFIYLRGEVVHVYRRLLRAVEEAYAAGYLGKNILGSGFDLDITVHAGAGAYICGEETALLDSLEGRRGQPRLKPPFPAVAGLYARPDRRQQRRVHRLGAARSCSTAPTGSPAWAPRSPPGFGIFSLSGHVKRPGQYEAPLGITLRELLDMAGGMRDRAHEAEVLDARAAPRRRCSPTSTSTCRSTSSRWPRRARCSAPARCRSSTRPPAWCAPSTRWTDFYAHESCGKCTPCREGTWWLRRSWTASSTARAPRTTSTSSLDICDNILGRAFCALGDGATSPITSASSTSARSSRPACTPPAAELFPTGRLPTLFAKEHRCPHDRHHQPRPRAATPSTRAATRRSRPRSTSSP